MKEAYCPEIYEKKRLDKKHLKRVQHLGNEDEKCVDPMYIASNFSGQHLSEIRSSFRNGRYHEFAGAAIGMAGGRQSNPKKMAMD